MFESRRSGHVGRSGARPFGLSKAAFCKAITLVLIYSVHLYCSRKLMVLGGFRLLADFQ